MFRCGWLINFVQYCLVMKPLLQKLLLAGDNSFVAKTFRTPHFEVGWHQHVEYELILFTEGAGLSLIGDYVGDFNTGDIFFLGSNLPHTFQKSGELITSAVVVQFREEIFGEPFLQLPEMQPVRDLFRLAGKGLKLTGDLRRKLAPLIQDMERHSGLPRLLGLLQCLQCMETEKEFSTLCMGDVLPASKVESSIEKVFQFTLDHFQENIALNQVASLTHRSVPAFCQYFKRSTKKTYIEFLNEVRTSHACRLLTETDLGVETIAFEAGYSTTGHFHRQFLRIKGTTPLQYRKSFNSYYS